MTTVAAVPRRTGSAAGGNLTGTAALVRLALRRDRIKLPLWLLGITVFVPYFFTVLSRSPCTGHSSSRPSSSCWPPR